MTLKDDAQVLGEALRSSDRVRSVEQQEPPVSGVVTFLVALSDGTTLWVDVEEGPA